MSLDTFKIFVFIRQDLPIAQQMVQSIHATFHASAQFGSYYVHSGVPYVVLIGVPDLKALRRVEKKLVANDILHEAFTDTDIDQAGPSAICTFPLSPEKSKLLASYRLWRYAPVAQDAVPVPTTGLEHSVFNREAIGPEPDQARHIPERI